MSKDEILIHPSAIVHPQARIGTGVQIGPFSIIGEKVSVEKNTRIGAHVYIEGQTQIGEANQIYPFCTIGTYPQDISYKGEETSVSIGDRNIIREYVTIHRGTLNGKKKTEVGCDNYFMAYSHVAHDCRIGNDTIFIHGATLGGHVSVDDHAQVGSLSGVHQFCQIGIHAFIGGGSIITQDVLPFCRVAGGRPTLFYGLNTVGLRRKGYSRERIRVLKDMFKIIFYSNLNTNQALERIKNEFPQSEDRDVIFNFVQSSKRGFVKKTEEQWGKDLE
jgi:UDP-N-acetylglucosamine acyltransferase